MLEAQLCGQSESHLTLKVDNTQLQVEAGKAYLSLQQAAAEAGFCLRIASGFRSYQRQAAIWQAKFDNLQHIPVPERLHEILRWSALPGASRHHWGTDMDIYDPVALGDAQLKLEPEEYLQGGPFSDLLVWLQLEAPRYGFFWPYGEDKGGIAAEPWHLSYQPVASRCLEQLSPKVLKQAWQQQPPAGHEQLLQHFDQLYNRYITNICSA
ncbi:hypothetical protein CWE09_03190 [Aliidiomarina minuta]|uniref:D-alanyl-D-alanine carboxypeptidase-like core domain-containing protein n=1 Tax=Aliidiomarina minuta TaxID=880057 RepID=A0A432W6Q3_9GAMM|nr:M15 family metallopeptidase [Aliidiomarina minuta]RUO25750.1 hypothetical protein CWE09_03190 [Aliidiomarina minuta]